MEFSTIKILSIELALKQRVERLILEVATLKTEDVTVLGNKSTIFLFENEMLLSKQILEDISALTTTLTVHDRIKAKDYF